MVRILVHAENDITWRGITRAISEEFFRKGEKVQILDISDFAYPKFRPTFGGLKALFPQEFRKFFQDVEIRRSGTISIRAHKWSPRKGEPTFTLNQRREVTASIRKLAMSVFNDFRPERHFVLFPILFRQQLSNCEQLFRKARAALSGLESIEGIVIPNGRFPHQLTLLLLAKELHIPVHYYERGFDPGPKFILSELSPHDRIGWQTDAGKRYFSDPEKVRDRTHRWLQSRMQPGSQVNEYSKAWESLDNSRLENDTDLESYSAVFFTSSQDEYLSMEGWEGYGWKDQYEAFADFSRHVSGLKGLRVHPNFLNKAFGHGIEEVFRILWLKRVVKDLDIVWPHEGRNSYGMIRSTSRIVVFGSTIGLEASALEKSVWIAGNSIYDEYADVRVLEKGVEHLKDYYEPWPVDPEPALRIVDYVLSNDRNIEPANLEPEAEVTPTYVRLARFLARGLDSYFFIAVQAQISKVVLKAVVVLVANAEKRLSR
jgi:hypothetical protein